jgi:hypothetical protein
VQPSSGCLLYRAITSVDQNLAVPFPFFKCCLAPLPIQDTGDDDLDECEQDCADDNELEKKQSKAKDRLKNNKVITQCLTF